MKELVCKIQPFDATQTFTLYENGVVKSNTKVPMDSFFAERVFTLAAGECVDCVYFKGHKKYSHGIVNQIKNYEKTHYHSNKLKIAII